MSGELRRSNRQRKSVYGNLDQSALLNENNPHYKYMLREANRQIETNDDGLLGHERAGRSGRRRVYVEDDEANDNETNNGRNDEHDEIGPRRQVKNRQRISDRQRPAARREVMNVSGPVESDGDTEEILDIYSRVKRRRRPTAFFHFSPERSAAHNETTPEKRQNNKVKDEEEEDEEPEENDGRSTDSETSVEERMERRYFLRQHKPVVKRFAFQLPEPKTRNHFESTPGDAPRPSKPRRDLDSMAFRSPAHKRYNRRVKRKRKLDHEGSSTSSSSDEEGKDRDDQKRFERRTAKSLDRARHRFLPLNLTSADATKGLLRDRIRATTGASCSDIDPMAIDRQVKFNSVGGLSHHIQSLKEMVLFPLLYPQVFEKFKISPPRGVVFYGPPGTGKTLVARALANECSQGDRKVAFFMRKGADCLSKWVGESERQLRLLFDQAYTMRPSIIFFDELDGLAPVRSTRQDQIHSSIVSTLLALMDGLDQRGEVVVIGATNRLDSLDPALRRPGRFDREFPFSLPDRTARKQILNIHTKDWDPPLEDESLNELSEKTVGFCGADLKGICTEAALIALRKRYPQIYCSDQKLQLDLNSIKTTCEDFELAMRKLVPASRRSLEISVKPLSKLINCLLGKTLETIVKDYIPRGFLPITNNEDSFQNAPYQSVLKSLQQRLVVAGGRMLICGQNADFGQTSHLSPAVLHKLDHLPVHSLSIATIFAVSSHRSPEEAVAQILQSVGRTGASNGASNAGPCVLFIPSIDEWYGVVSASVWRTLVSVLEGWDAFTSVLLFATSHTNYEQLPDEIQNIFRRTETLSLSQPTADERKMFLEQIFLHETTKEPENKVIRYETLAIAHPVQPYRLSESELKVLLKQEEGLLRQLRIFLREMLGRLIRDRRFTIFSKPVDPEEVPDYTEVISNPMDLSSMMNKIDKHQYDCVKKFLDDIELITQNALEYNPDRDQTDKLIRHRGCALRDTAYALIDTELDPDFENRLQEVRNAKKRRGTNCEVEVPPPFLVTKPKSKQSTNSGSNGDSDRKSRQSRYSTRSHGPAPDLHLEDVGQQSNESGAQSPQQEEKLEEMSEHKIVRLVSPNHESAPCVSITDELAQCSSLNKNETTKNEEKTHKKRNTTSIWCRPTKRKRVSLQRKRQVLHRQSTKIIKKYKAQKRLFIAGASGSSMGDSRRSTPKEDPVAMETNCPTPPIQLPEPEPPELFIDVPSLEIILDLAISKTDGWTVGSLDRLSAAVIQVIDGYRNEWDRSKLAQELMEVVEKWQSC